MATVNVDSINIRHETASAILIETEDGEELWIPLSQVEVIHRSLKMDFSSGVEMSEWIAAQKGLI